MAKNAFDRLDSRLKELAGTRGKLETLHSQQHMARRDLERVYEGLFVAAITSFEDFLEGRFYELMMKPKQRPAGVKPRVDFKSPGMLEDFVLGGRRYVSWLPYSRTSGRAEVYLRGGRPFDSLSKTETRQMEDWMVIRHAIAHTSQSARTRFQREVIGGLLLLPQERTPAGFLRSTITPGTTRYENISGQMRAVGLKL